LLMVIFGFAWFGGRLTFVDSPLLYTIGLFLAALFFAVLGQFSSPFPADGWRDACRAGS
jgi:hypothetical protein